MPRIEATIISSAIRIISLAFFILQVGINLLGIPNMSFLVIVPIVTALLVGMAGWGFAVIIDLLAGIEAALKKRNPTKPKVEDWQAHPPSRAYPE